MNNENDDLLKRMAAITGEKPKDRPKTDNLTSKQRAAIEKGAEALGIDPVDYATAISYESSGTFDPWVKGPVTKWGQHRGTIQYGEPQRKTYGVYEGQSFEDQVTNSNVRYLKDAGVKPGDNFTKIYAAINGGSSKANLKTQDADTGRTIADNIRKAETEHRQKVLQKFWGGVAPIKQIGQTTLSPQEEKKTLDRMRAITESSANVEDDTLARMKRITGDSSLDSTQPTVQQPIQPQSLQQPIVGNAGTGIPVPPIPLTPKIPFVPGQIRSPADPNFTQQLERARQSTVNDEKRFDVGPVIQTEDGKTLRFVRKGAKPGEVIFRDIRNEKGGEVTLIDKGKGQYQLPKSMQPTQQNGKPQPILQKPTGKQPIAKGKPGQIPDEIPLADGRKLKKADNQENLKEGNYRFVDDNGDSWIADPANKKVYEEAANDIVENIPVKLVPKEQRNSVDPQTAKQLYINQVADYLSKKYDGTMTVDNPNGLQIRYEDVLPWMEKKGLISKADNKELTEDKYYSNGLDSERVSLPGQAGITNQHPESATGTSIQDFNNPISTTRDYQSTTHAFTKRELRDLAEFSFAEKSKLENTALGMLSAKGEFSPDDVRYFEEQGLDLQKLQKDRFEDYQLALTKGQVNKQKFLQRREEIYQKSGDKYTADLEAKKETGILPAKIAQAEIDKYNELKESKRQEFEAQTQQGGQNDFQNLNLARIGNPNMPVYTPSQTDAKVNQYMQQMLEMYGSATNREKKIKDEEMSKAIAANRVANMTWGEYLGEMGKTVPANIVRSALETSISGTWRGIALASNFLDDNVLNLSGKNKNVEDYETYKIAENFSKILREYLPVNEDLVNSGGITGFVAGDFSQGFGSSIGMAAGGYAKYSKTAIALLSSLQMGGDAYREARELGISPEKAQYAAMWQLPLGATEIFGMGKILERLNTGKGATVWRKLFADAWNNAVTEVPEEIFQEGLQTVSQNIIQNKIYDPDKKWSDGVFNAMAAAGFSAGVSTAGVSILNHIRLRNVYNQLIKKEEANGVIIQHYGDNEAYAFGQKIPVNNQTASLLKSFDNARNGIEEVQAEIESVKEKARNDIKKLKLVSLNQADASQIRAIQKEAVGKLTDLRNELNQLQKRQGVIAKEIVEKAGIQVPQETIGETVVNNAEPGNTEQPSVPPIGKKDNETTETPKNELAVNQKVQIEGKGEGTIVEDKGKNVVVDFNNGESRIIVRKNQVTPIEANEINSSENSEPVQPEQKQEFEHTDFGRVTESDNQSGVPKDKIRVEDKHGKFHVIQKPKKTGAGNQKAIPVRVQGLRFDDEQQNEGENQPQTDLQSNKEAQENQQVTQNSEEKTNLQSNESDNLNSRYEAIENQAKKLGYIGVRQFTVQNATTERENLSEEERSILDEVSNLREEAASIKDVKLAAKLHQNLWEHWKKVNAPTTTGDGFEFSLTATPQNLQDAELFYNALKLRNDENESITPEMVKKSIKISRQDTNISFEDFQKRFDSEDSKTTLEEYNDIIKSRKEYNKALDLTLERINKESNKKSNVQVGEAETVPTAAKIAVPQIKNGKEKSASVIKDSSSSGSVIDLKSSINSSAEGMPSDQTPSAERRIDGLSSSNMTNAERSDLPLPTESAATKTTSDLSISEKEKPTVPKTKKEKKLEKLAKEKKTRSAPKANASKHSLSTFVKRSGGLKSDGVIDVSAVKNAKGGNFIVGKNRLNVEDAFRLAVEAGYFADKNTQYSPGAENVANQNYDFTVNDFVEAVASDANGFQKHYSSEAIDQITGTIEDQQAKYYEEKAKEEGLTDEQFDDAVRLQMFLKKPEIKNILENLAKTGEISETDTESFINIGYYENDIPREQLKNFLDEAQIAATSRSLAQEITVSDSADNFNGSESSNQTFYNEEIDETEPEGEVDDSFDFGDNLNNSQYTTNLFGEKIAPTHQESLFGKNETAEINEDFSKANIEATREAFGNKTADYISEMLRSKDKLVRKVAEDIITTGTLVKSKGKEAKQIIENVSDALELFRLAKEQNSSVSEVLRQPRLDGVNYSDQAKEFAQSMENATFSGKFKKSLSDAKTSQNSSDGLSSKFASHDQTNNDSETNVNSDKEIVKKIEDFGEKIGGAKKDLWKERISKINADDIRTKPLSKSFPQPDYAQLINDGIVTLEGAKFLKFMYDNIPPKPRKTYRIESWAKQVEEVISLFKDLTENEATKNTDFTDKILNAKGYSDVKRRFEIFSAIADEFGFPNNAVNTGSYDIRQMSVKGKNVFTIIANKTFIVKDFDTLKEAAKGLKSLMDDRKDEVKTTKFDIYEDRKTKDLFIGKKDATGVVRIMEGFKSVKEASEFRTENQSQLENIWAGMKVKPEERNDVTRDRVGVDWRKGKNISPQEFSDTFGFRGVEFGNWVNNSERQQSINDAYDALMDLSNVLKVSPKALSLNGELGLAFGSRGGGRVAAAHYESDRIVINLTKTKGKGSLGHEWWHALDNYFSRMRGEIDNYLTEKPRSILVKQDNKWVEDSAVRKEMISAYKGIVDAIKSTDLPNRSTILDRTKTKRYWSTNLEMTARAFENFLIEKLGQNNERNDYLANFKDTSQWLTDSKLSLDNYPYPLKDEQEVINSAFQNFFNAIEEEETDTGIKLKAVEENSDGISLDSLYNEKGDIDYEQLENISNGIERGDIAITRLNEAEEQGRIDGGRRNVEASLIAGAKDSSVERDGEGSRFLSWGEHKQIVKPQEDALEKYAKDNGIWFDYQTLDNEYGFFTQGTEADVFFDKDDNYLLKAVGYDFAIKQSPLEFIDNRISIHNFLFPETKYELVGFTRDEGGFFRFVLRQQFITKKGKVTNSELKKYLKDNYGLEPSKQNLDDFVNDRYVVNDLHALNVIKSKSGIIHFIDPIIYLDKEKVEISPLKIKSTQPFGLKAIEENPSGPEFYSAVERVIENAKQEKFSVDQVKALFKTPGIKQEELEWLDIDSFLDGKQKVSKSDLLDYIRANSVEIKEVVKGTPTMTETESARFNELLAIGRDRNFTDAERKEFKKLQEISNQYQETLFSQYVLPGGENYKELLLTLPLKRTAVNFRIVTDYQGKINKTDKPFSSREEAQAWIDDMRDAFYPETKWSIEEDNSLVKDGANNYTSRHWAEENVLVHIRFDERTDSEGRRTLHIAEIQSDWHQEGRKKGYKNDSRRESAKKRISDGIGTDEDWRIVEETAGQVPDAPFKKSWQELAFKKALRYAIENGFDAISWDTGATNADRYDLSKQISSLQYKKNENGNYDLHPFGLDGFEISDDSFKNLSESDLEETIGKDIAQKIVNEEGESKKGGFNKLSGVDLKVGGEGMAGFYDKILPAFVKKYIKKWGAALGTSSVTIKSRFKIEENRGLFEVYAKDKPSDLWTLESFFETKAEADQWIKDSIRDYGDWENSTETVHSVEITPQMRESVLSGQPLFAMSEDEKKEQFQVVKTKPTSEIAYKAEVSRNGSAVHLNIEAEEILRRAAEESDIRKGRKKIGDKSVEASFSGQFYDGAMTKETINTLRAVAKEARNAGYVKGAEAISKIADELEAAQKEGQGTFVAYVFDKRLPHEYFHQASYLGDVLRDLRSRHTKVKELDSHKVTQATADYLLEFDEYRRMKKANSELFKAVVREEAAAYIAGGELFEGISEDDAADFMNLWFDSYIEKNGIESLKNFEVIEGYVQEIIEQIKNSFAQNEDSQQNGSTSSSGGKSEQNTGGTQGSNESSSGESQKGENRRLSAGGESTQVNPDTKLRRLPANLRMNEIDAEDSWYEIQHDTDAKAEASKMLQDLGLQGAVDLLTNIKNPDASHAQLAFMVAQTLSNNAARFEEEGDLESAKIVREEQAKFTKNLAVQYTKAGQFISAARVIANSPTGLVMSAQAIIESMHGKDRTLSPEQIQKYEELGKKLQKAVNDLNEANKNLRNEKAKNKRLQDKLDGKTPARRSSRSGKARTKLVELVKEEKAKEVASLLGDLRKELGLDLGLKAIEDRNILKELEDQATNPIDPGTMEKIAKIGALTLIDKINAKDDEVYIDDHFFADMISMLGESIRPHMDSIYYESMKMRDKWLKEVALKSNKTRMENKLDSILEGDYKLTLGRELTDEDIYEILDIERGIRRNRAAVEKFHLLSSGFKKSNLTDELTKTIIELAPTPEIAIAAKILADNPKVSQFYAKLDQAGIEVETVRKRIAEFWDNFRNTKSFADFRNSLSRLFAEDTTAKLFVQGKELLKQAKDKIVENNVEILQKVADQSTQLTNASSALWQKRQEQQQVAEEIANEFSKLKNGKVKHYAKATWEALMQVPNNLKATGEFSFIFRQGGRFITSEFLRLVVNSIGGQFTQDGHNIKADLNEQYENLAALFRSLKSAEGFGQTVMKVEDDPLFGEAESMGLQFSSAGKIGTGAKAGEEQLNSTIAESIPIYGALVKRFDESMAGTLDTLRMMMYRRMRESLVDAGFDPVQDKQEFVAIAKEVNRGTGKANKFENFKPAQDFVNFLNSSHLPFAANYTVSNWQKIGADVTNVSKAIGNIVTFRGLPKGAQAQMLKRAAYSYSSMCLIYGVAALALGAFVGLDPDDDDFLKFKWGNYRYDVSFGLKTELKFIGRVMKSLIRGNRVPNEQLYDLVTLPGRYVRGKLNVLPGFVIDAMTGSDITGKDFSLADWTRWVNLFIPITYSNAISTGYQFGPQASLATLPLEFVGVGTAVYEDRPEQPETEAEKLALKIKQMKKPFFSPVTYKDKIDQLMWNEITKLKSRSRKGEDVSAEVEKLQNSGKISERIANDILKAKGQTILQEFVEDARMGDSEIKAIYNVANDNEKADLKPIFEARFKAKDKKYEMTAEDRKELDQMGLDIPGDVPMPKSVESEMARLKITKPDVSGSLTITKGQGQVELTREQQNKYRSDILTNAYKNIEKLVSDKRYQAASDEDKESMIRKEISFARKLAQNSIKAEIRPSIPIVKK